MLFMDCERGIPRNGQCPPVNLLPNLCRIMLTVQEWLAEAGRFGQVPRTSDTLMTRETTLAMQTGRSRPPRQCARIAHIFDVSPPRCPEIPDLVWHARHPAHSAWALKANMNIGLVAICNTERV